MEAESGGEPLIHSTRDSPNTWEAEADWSL